MNYIDKIKKDMYSAMKADQKVKANILRSLLAALKKVEIETKNTLSEDQFLVVCLLYTSPSPRDYAASRMPSSA